MLGSAVVGGVLGVSGGLATYLALGRGARDPFFDTLARAAADRYVTTSITAWEFARGKLRGDPLYRDVLLGGWLPSGGRLLDIGCGQGLMLALLAEAERSNAQERRQQASAFRVSIAWSASSCGRIGHGLRERRLERTLRSSNPTREPFRPAPAASFCSSTCCT